METTQSKTGDTFKVTGNWETQSKSLKTQFSQLTDSDVKFETGKEEELVSRLQTKLSKSREDVLAILKKTQTEKV